MASDLRAALEALWVWASEQRTDLTSEPVPDGLGALVLAALAAHAGAAEAQENINAGKRRTWVILNKAEAECRQAMHEAPPTPERSEP